MKSALEFRAVDILFCAKTSRRASAQAIAAALTRLDGGGSRSEIAEQTGVVVGVANASLAVAQGEISVLMGLSGSGQVHAAARGQRPQRRHPRPGAGGRRRGHRRHRGPV